VELERKPWLCHGLSVDNSSLVTANFDLNSSETSVLTRATRRRISKDGIPRSHRRGNLKSYIALTVWAL
jgi:hypothetical protein